MTQTPVPIAWRRDDGLLPKRNVGRSVARGSMRRCPACGRGAMFRAYLKVADACPCCAEPLHHHRADDAPPYFTIVLVGHVVIPLALALERFVKPDLWVSGTLLVALTVALALLALPAVKGALVAYQWALYMHGFDPRSGGDETWDGVGHLSRNDAR